MGGYHGAGIGGGYFTSYSSTLTPAVVDPNTGNGYSGNITINGGYSDSYGGVHGSAFGDGCINPTSHLGYQIVVTGGTILAHLTQSNYWTSDLSAVGGDVFVTGGSLRADTFQSAGESVAYGDMEKKTKVFMTTISLNYLGVDKVGTTLVEDFDLLIAGKKSGYGAPSYTDEQGLLYLWLPSDTQGKEVTVNTTVKDKTSGETITPESFFITNVAPNSKLKQYAVCTIPNDVVPKEVMTKRYDGIAFDESVENQFLENLINLGGIPVQNPVGGKLTDRSKMKIESRRLKDDTLEPDTDYEGGLLRAQRDAGKYELVITSTEYAQEAGFADAYWGHRGYYKYAEITKADTETRATVEKTVDVKPGEPVAFEIKVRPAQNEGTECAAPRGAVQFYVDGKKYGAPVKLEENNVPEEKEENHYFSTASAAVTVDNIAELIASGGKKTIRVEYIGEDINYTVGSFAEIELQFDLKNIDVNGDGKADINIDVDGDGIPDLNIDTDGDLKPDVNVDTNNDSKPDINIDTDNSGEWKPSGEGGNADGIWKPDTSIDTNGDGKGDKDHHRKPVDTDKDGVDDNWKPNKDVTTGEVEYDTADPSINIDTNGDGTPDINIDVDGDGKPDINIDTDGDLKPDVNIDTDGDKQPDINIDTDGDKQPDINIDTDGDKQPDINIDTDGDKQPDINIDTDGDKQPDINIDTDGDGQPDINIDTDGDKQPDINIDTDGDKQPDINIDTDGDKQPDINIDTDGDKQPDINIDTDGDKQPDINIDTDGDKQPDINIDTDGDGQPDINIDTNGDKQPDINIDTDGDKQPDINIDTDGDNKPDINIDTDGDNKPDINIDTNGDKKPDINIDTNGDKQPDINIDIDGDGKPDLNIDTDKDGKPDINIDTDKDGKPDINIDTDNTGEWKPSGQGGNADGIWKPDTSIDTDGDGKGDKDNHRKPVDTDKDGVDDNWKPDKDVSTGDTAYDTGDPGIDPGDSVKPDVKPDVKPEPWPPKPSKPTKPSKPNLPHNPSEDGGLLNKDDHFAYIIGYPVDYITGEPTNDQTRMPVRPQGKITRAEVATIYFRMLTDEVRNKYWTQNNSFSDVNLDDWFNNAVSTMANAGIIQGYPDGTFRPNAYITRAEFAAIAVRFFDVQYNGANLFPDVEGHWASDYINKAASIKLINGYPDGTFGPNRQITRAEAVALVNRTLDRHPDEDHLLSDMLRWPDNMDTTQWYYADMQEATNSHAYKWMSSHTENWTYLREARDWAAFEKAWSTANSAHNPGEVLKKGA